MATPDPTTEHPKNDDAPTGRRKKKAAAAGASDVPAPPADPQPVAAPPADAPAAAVPDKYRSRFKGPPVVVPANTLKPHPRNWRLHPEYQQQSMAAVLERVGVVDRLIAYDDPEWGRTLVNGHLRAGLFGDAPVEVQLLDITRAEAEEVLATFDALTGLATPDVPVLAGLLGDLHGAGVPLTDMGWPEFKLDAILNGPGWVPPAATDPAAGGGVDVSGGGTGGESAPRKPVTPDEARTTLVERFGVPPFSVLDARQGYWQDRKRAWLAFGIRSELGRGEAGDGRETASATGGLTWGTSCHPYDEYGKKKNAAADAKTFGTGGPGTLDAQRKEWREADKAGGEKVHRAIPGGGTGKNSAYLFRTPSGEMRPIYKEQAEAEAAAAGKKHAAARDGDGVPTADLRGGLAFRMTPGAYGKDGAPASPGDAPAGENGKKGLIFGYSEWVTKRVTVLEPGVPLFDEIRGHLRDVIKTSGKTYQELADALGVTTGMIGHYVGNSQPEVPTPEHWRTLREILPGLSAEYDGPMLTVETVPGAESMKQVYETTGTGTSVFDPVLCELAYSWFCPPGGSVYDPFAGGSVRGLVASVLGRSYTGVDLSERQVAANRGQVAPVLAAAGKTPPGPPPAADGPPDFTPALTPVERRGEVWLKRDDLFCVAGVRGGKVRSCWHLSQGAAGLVTAGSRSSPQVNIVARIARRLGVPCRAHTPTGELSPEVAASRAAGAEIVQHKAGYNSVIVKRARDDAAARPGWREIPFGMECAEAVRQTAGQVGNLPPDAARLVVPVGSGMSLAGILHGLAAVGNTVPVLGVVVGADPSERLDAYAPAGWRERVELVPAGVDYHDEVTADVGGVVLDPVYEAKCVRFLKPGDVLWCVGVRQTVSDPGPAAAVGAAGRVSWHVGDSTAPPADVAPPPGGFDFVFTCPPYADLERYSDDPRDLSTMPYPEFIKGFRAAVKRAADMLAPDRFAAVVVGEVRGPDGTYYGFVPDTIRAFEDAGLRLYNEAILVTAVGSLPIRAGRQFAAGRKLGKTHQNVLVFVKGDARQATAACGPVEIDPALLEASAGPAGPAD